MADPYATHLPVLKDILARKRPERVLEFGGGGYSTPLFLGCWWLKELRTVERDAGWRKELRQIDDSRLIIQSSGTPSPVRFDLVFIDDGVNAAEREQTIRYVLTRKHPITVIHDSEAYLPVIDQLSTHYEIFNHERPGTAVCW